ETQMTITVLGGGPAGAFTGERVASAGLPVTIIDEKLAWEKPCGGGLTAKALETYPFLAAGDAPKRFIDRAVLVTSNRARAARQPPPPRPHRPPPRPRPARRRQYHPGSHHRRQAQRRLVAASRQASQLHGRFLRTSHRRPQPPPPSRNRTAPP